MDWKSFIFASYEVVLAVIFSLFTVFITMKILRLLMFRNRDADENAFAQNTAVAIFSGAIIVSVLVLVNSSISPSIDTLRTMVFSANSVSMPMLGTSFLYFLMFFFLSIIISTLVIFLTLKVYISATIKLDEFAALREHNIGVAIVMSLVILGISLSIRPSLQRFISSLVNYEYLETSYTAEDQESEKKEKMKIPVQEINPGEKNQGEGGQ